MDATKGTVGLLGLLATFVLGGASGYAARLGLEGDAWRGEAGTSVSPDLARLENMLVDLRSALEQWNRRLEVPSAAAMPAREPLEPDEEPLDLAALRELVTRFERAAQAIPARSAGSLVIPQGRPLPLPPEPAQDEDWQELRERYLLQSYQQIVDAFGRPDSVWPAQLSGASCVLWKYAREAGDRAQDFDFYFRDGLVIEIDP
jgi:hypothetical protein